MIWSEYDDMHLPGKKVYEKTEHLYKIQQIFEDDIWIACDSSLHRPCPKNWELA